MMQCLHFLIILLSCMAMPSVIHACSSSRHHQHAMAANAMNNVVDNFPYLFRFARGPLAQVKAREHCPKSETTTCRLVDVDLSVLKSPKMRLPLDVANPSAGIVLKKVSQEGLELVLDNEKSRATATVVYKVSC